MDGRRCGLGWGTLKALEVHGSMLTWLRVMTSMMIWGAVLEARLWLEVRLYTCMQGGRRGA